MSPIRARLAGAVGLSAVLTLLAGCTVYPEQRQVTAGGTTSAEQMQRILWKDVQDKRWNDVNALLSPNVVWRAGSRVLYRNDVVPWLKELGIKGATVTDVALRSNVNDITLVYGLQMQAQQAAVTAANAPSAANASGCLQNLHAIAVWQQPQPTVTPAKGANTGYLLTVEDLALDATGTGGCGAQ